MWHRMLLTKTTVPTRMMILVSVANFMRLTTTGEQPDMCHLDGENLTIVLNLSEIGICQYLVSESLISHIHLVTLLGDLWCIRALQGDLFWVYVLLEDL